MAKKKREHRWFRFLRSRWFHIWLLMLALSFLLILVAVTSGNQALIPAAFFYAAAAGPVALLVATHTRTGFAATVPPVTLLGMFLFGGGVALAIGGLLDQVIIGSAEGTVRMWWVGPIEEGAKFIPVLAVALIGRYLFKAGGLALGMSVAAGFEILESMAYGYASMFSAGLLQAEGVLVLRGLTAPFSHLAWTGLLCAVAFAAWQRRGRVTVTWGIGGTFLLVSFLHSANDALLDVLPGWLSPLYLLVPIASYGLFRFLTRDLNLSNGAATVRGNRGGDQTDHDPVNPAFTGWATRDLQDGEIPTHAEEIENSRRPHHPM